MKKLFFTALFAATLMVYPLHSTWAEEDAHDHGQQGDRNLHGKDEGDEHGHEDHDEHEEGKTEIGPEHAAKAGIKLSVARAGTIAKEVVLNGQITLNRDTTANVRARFPGIVRNVPVKLGQIVKKGDVLARLESNESLRDYNITAPVSGVILERNTNVGDVTNDETLFVIANLSNVLGQVSHFSKGY